MDKTLPIQKTDIQYNSEAQEVTLKREKFDALMRYVRDAMKELDEAEEDREIAEYQRRRASASESIFKIIVDDLEFAYKAISGWVEEHSIQELSTRSGVPYATCHRIVETRLKEGNVSMKQLQSLFAAIEPKERIPERVHKPIVVGTIANPARGTGVIAAKGGRAVVEFVKLESGAKPVPTLDKHPDVVIVDTSLPAFKGLDVAKIVRSAPDAPGGRRRR